MNSDCEASGDSEGAEVSGEDSDGEAGEEEYEHETVWQLWHTLAYKMTRAGRMVQPLTKHVAKSLQELDDFFPPGGIFAIRKEDRRSFQTAVGNLETDGSNFGLLTHDGMKEHRVRSAAWTWSHRT